MTITNKFHKQISLCVCVVLTLLTTETPAPRPPARPAQSEAHMYNMYHVLDYKTYQVV